MGAHEKALATEHPCANPVHHAPPPARSVRHHILPLEAGGTNTDDNKVWLCDTDHYTVHHIMYEWAQGRVVHGFDAYQRNLAAEGYGRAVAAGTVDKIPNEG